MYQQLAPKIVHISAALTFANQRQNYRIFQQSAAKKKHIFQKRLIKKLLVSKVNVKTLKTVKKITRIILFSMVKMIQYFGNQLQKQCIFLHWTRKWNKF